MYKNSILFSLLAILFLMAACSPSTTADPTSTPIVQTVVHSEVFEVVLTQEVTRVIEVTVVVTNTPAPTSDTVVTATPTRTTAAVVNTATPTPPAATPEATADSPSAAATLPANAQEALATQRLYINASEESQAVGLVKKGDPIVVIARTSDSNWLYVEAIDSQLEGFVLPSIVGLTSEQVAERYAILGQ